LAFFEKLNSWHFLKIGFISWHFLNRQILGRRKTWHFLKTECATVKILGIFRTTARVLGILKPDQRGEMVSVQTLVNLF